MTSNTSASVKGIYSAEERDSGPSFLEALHVFTLFSFALSQPVFDILSQNPEFLVAHETTLPDLVISILIPIALAPLAVVLLERLVGLVNEDLRRKLHILAVFCLLVAILNPPLKALPDSLDGLRALGALLLGVAGAVAYSRWESARTFLTFLSPSILAFPIIFLSYGHIWEAVWRQPQPPVSHSNVGQSPRAGIDVPVVILVFDELPLTSLLDADESIDAARYPHFAALARTSTWYRKATTVSDNSTFAITSLVTGKYPDPQKIPISRHYPDTMFSLFAPSHEIKAFESATLLCPPDLQEIDQSGDGPRGKRLSLFFDTAVIYPRIVMPAKVAKHLPRVSNTWEGFGDPHDWLFKRWLGELAADRLENLAGFLSAIELGQKAPSLFFVHLLLPHSPFHFLPNGQRYRLSGNPTEVPEETWESEEQVLLSYYRHLLQLGFVDQVLGEIVDRLKNNNLYDRSLLCLVSDHGISFRVKDSPRRLSLTNAADILSVPLFIKTPGQTEGCIDERSIELIDVVPTIAEILQMKIPWAINGRAASRLPTDEETKKPVLRATNREWISVAVNPQAKDLSLRKKIEWFGTGADENRIFFPNVRSSQIDQLSSQIAKIYGISELPHKN